MRPGLPLWLPHTWQAATPQTSDAVSGGLHQVGSLAGDTESPGVLAEEASLVLTSVPDARWVLLSMCVSGSHYRSAFSPALVCVFLCFWKLLFLTFTPH